MIITIETGFDCKFALANFHYQRKAHPAGTAHRGVNAIAALAAESIRRSRIPLGGVPHHNPSRSTSLRYRASFYCENTIPNIVSMTFRSFAFLAISEPLHGHFHILDELNIFVPQSQLYQNTWQISAKFSVKAFSLQRSR